MEIEELLKTAASPHLVASAAKANELLSHLNGILTDLRMEVADLELKADLHLNELMRQEGKTVELKKSEWKVSEIYREWKDKSGKLSDIRAIRRNLERHANLLYEQEKYKPRGYERAV